jgi:hypothetical protein
MGKSLDRRPIKFAAVPTRAELDSFDREYNSTKDKGASLSVQDAINIDSVDEDTGKLAQASSRHILPVVEREIELLLSLVDSDDAIADLEALWTTEKEVYMSNSQSEGGVSLKKAKTSTMGWLSLSPSSLLLQMSKGQLRRQIRQHPSWAEPKFRLAQLYSGDTDKTLEALEMCLQVLDLKPWHIGVHDLLLRLSLRRKDLGMALTWARLRLPRLNGARTAKGKKRRVARRKAWVDRAVAQATEELEILEGKREQSMMETAGLVIPSDAWL